MKQLFKAFVRDTQGQDLIEYALLAATLALGTLGAVQAVRDAINTEFTNISTTLGS